MGLCLSVRLSVRHKSARSSYYAGIVSNAGCILLQAHAIGVQNENAETKTNKPGQSASSTSAGSVGLQAVRIQKIIESTTGEQTEDAIAYRRLMNAVYTLVVNGQPLSAFHTV